MRRFMSALAIFTFITTAAQAQVAAPPAPAPRAITMSGEGEVFAVPDQASISIGVSTFAQKPKEALARNTQAMQKVIDGLKKSGLEEKDIATTDFSVNPRMSYPENQQPKLEGFDVSNNVRVTVRDLTKLGALLEAAIGDGSNAVNGLSLTVSDTAALLDEARRKAYADAERRARLYAEAAGAKLGPMLSISEGGGAEPPRPIMAKMALDATSAAPVPISSGEQRLGISVNVTWRLD